MDNIQREAFTTTKLATTYIINDENESTGNMVNSLHYFYNPL